MKTRKHYVDIIFIVVLVAMFALSSVTLAMLGVKVYKTASTDTSSQTLSTASLYFAQKIRQCDNRGSVRTATLSGKVPALVVSSTAGGKNLETWVYVHDGKLKEVTVTKGNKVNPSFGQDVMSLKSVDFEIVDDELLKITMTVKGNKSSIMNLDLLGGDTSE